MVLAPENRRVAMLIGLVGLVLFSFFVEQALLVPGIAATQPEEEVAYWEEHIERNELYAESRIRLGLAYQRAERLDEAQGQFEIALTLNPDSEEAAIGRYGILTTKEQYDSAVSGLTHFVQDHPHCGICWQNLAAAYLARGQLDDAEMAAEALLESSLRMGAGVYSAKNLRFEAKMVAGRVFAERGEYDRALLHFGDAIREEPSNVRGYVLKAKVSVASGRPAKALSILDQAQNVLARDDTWMRQEIQRLRNKANRALSAN